MMVCRICLASDRKMFSLNKQLYENVTGIVIPPLDRLPKYMCWECRNYMSKYFTFRSKAVTSHFILTEILMTQNITSSALTKYQPKSPLVCTKTLYLYLDGAIHDEAEKVNAKLTNDDMDYVNETDHIWEVRTDNITHDSNEIYIKTEEDHYRVDYTPDFTIVKIEETNEHEDSIEKPKENVENFIKVEVKEEIDDSECIEEENDMEISIENIDQANDIEQEQSDKNINSTESSDCNPEDVTDDDNDESSILSKSIDDHNSNSVGDTSNKPVGDTNKSIRKGRLDKDMFTMVTLTRDEQLAEWEERAERDEYVNSQHKCMNCFMGFSDVETYNQHLEMHSKEMGPFECPVCKLRFCRRLAVTIHMRTHSLRICCNECDFVTNTNALAIKHQQVHKGNKAYGCKLCDASFAHSQSYFSHVRIKHPSDALCQLCGFSFTSDAGLRMHERRMHADDPKTIPEDGPYCELCDLRFLSQEAFDNHKTRSAKHEGVGVHVRRRKKPPREFVASSVASQHLLIHQGGKRYECKLCGALFAHSQSYFSHVRIKHPSNIICQLCGCSFVGETGLRMHESKIHADDPKTIPEDGPYCDRCDLRFASQFAFDNHKIWSAQHVDDERVGRKIPRRRKKTLSEDQGRRSTSTRTTPKSYSPCEQSASGVGSHQEKPPRTGPFTCDLCGKKYTIERFLMNHQLRCGEVLRLPCKVCGMVFNSSSNLSRHLELHQGLTYTCEVCLKVFKHPADRRNHINFVHMKRPRPIRKNRNRNRTRGQGTQPEKPLETDQPNTSSAAEANNSNSNTSTS